MHACHMHMHVPPITNFYFKKLPVYILPSASQTECPFSTLFTIVLGDFAVTCLHCDNFEKDKSILGAVTV